MWTCSKCREQVEDGFDACWNCGTSREGIEDPDFVRDAVAEQRARPTEPDERGTRDAVRSIDQLIFVGLNGYALALDRDTGQIVWSNSEMHSGYVALLLDGDRLIVSTNGYMYCLDPLTGRIRWHNPLRGYMVGVPSLASVRGKNPSMLLPQAAQQAGSRRN